MWHYLKFLSGTLKNPFQTGAIFPSSKVLGAKMLAPLNLHPAELVVEIGPGTGALTAQIESQIQDPSRYLGFELNEDFYKHFKKKFPHLTLLHENAEKLSEVLGPNRKADFVISSLPWTVFTEDVQVRLFNAILEGLKPEGEFCTYSYLQALALPGSFVFRRLLHQYFSRVWHSPIIWSSMPPAIVFYAGDPKKP